MADLKGYEELQTRFRALSSGSSSFMRLLGLAAVREQKLLVRRKTGTTGRSIRLGPVTATTAVTQVGFAGAFLEFGTRAHEITPRARKALRWAASSSRGFRLSGAPRKNSVVTWAFAKRVHHPGTRPQPFMLPGARKAVGMTTDLVVERWNQAG